MIQVGLPISCTMVLETHGFIKGFYLLGVFSRCLISKHLKKIIGPILQQYIQI